MNKGLNLKQRNNFLDKAFLNTLFTISFPIMLQNFLNSFVNILDTIMIGRLGTIAIAAVGLGNQLFFLLNLILYGTASGGMVFTSQFWGKKDLSGLKKTLGISMGVALFFSIIFTIACMVIPEKILLLYSKDAAVIALGSKYLKVSSLCFVPFAISFILIVTLRSIEQVKTAVAVTLVSLSVNLILNAVLIFGLFGFPAMGVTGAATATVAARITELIVLFVIIKKKKYPILGKLREHFSFSPKFFITYFAVVLPVIFNESIWSLGITFHHKIFANLNTFAYAAFNITNTVFQLTWVIFVGLGNGISVLIGKKIGEENYEQARKYANRIAVYTPILALAVGIFLIFLSLVVPHAFDVEYEVINLTRNFLFILTLCYPSKAFNLTMIVGILRSGGDTKFCVIYDTLFMWIISIPLAYYLSIYATVPVWLIYLSLFADEPIKIMMGVFRLKSGKWLHSVVSDN